MKGQQRISHLFTKKAKLLALQFLTKNERSFYKLICTSAQRYANVQNSQRSRRHIENLDNFKEEKLKYYQIKLSSY